MASAKDSLCSVGVCVCVCIRNCVCFSDLPKSLLVGNECVSTSEGQNSSLSE